MISLHILFELPSDLLLFSGDNGGVPQKACNCCSSSTLQCIMWPIKDWVLQVQVPYWNHHCSYRRNLVYVLRFDFEFGNLSRFLLFSFLLSCWESSCSVFCFLLYVPLITLLNLDDPLLRLIVLSYCVLPYVRNLNSLWWTGLSLVLVIAIMVFVSSELTFRHLFLSFRYRGVFYPYEFGNLMNV